MNALPKTSTDNVIDFSALSKKVIRGGLSEKKPRLNKDGTVSKVRSYKVAGVSSEVYAFTEEEIGKMIEVFNRHIEEAPNENRKWIASRNKMLFLVGVNTSLRASDLCDIQWNTFFNEDGTFKKECSLQPKKTRKTRKFVKIYFNEVIKKAITGYLEQYPMDNTDDYVFKSRVGDGHITEKSLGRIIKNTAKEAGIEKNINSHSLRKTFGALVYHRAVDKSNALIVLQKIFNHSSPAITSKYIGLTDAEISETFNELNIGLEFI